MSEIKRTPLYEEHLRLGGRMVEFAGYELPVQYESTGIIDEHNAVRNGAGLFDVSHMGEFHIYGAGAEVFLNRLISNDITGMENGKVIYALLCNDNGGVIDDLLLYKYADNDYLMVVNASNTDKDFAWVMEHLPADAVADNISDQIAQIALQGPQAEAIIGKLIPEAELPIKNYTFVQGDYFGVNCIVSRTGYTGEDGFEIYCPAASATSIWNTLLQAGTEEGLTACGLGARDTLRFEAGMPLYGHELGDDIPANECGLNFAIKLNKTTFVGKQAIEGHVATHCRRGIKLTDRGIAREGSKLFQGEREIGYVTSGTFSVTNNCALAMVRIEKGIEGVVEVEVRKKRLKAEFVKLPFIEKRNNK